LVSAQGSSPMGPGMMGSGAPGMMGSMGGMGGMGGGAAAPAAPAPSTPATEPGPLSEEELALLEWSVASHERWKPLHAELADAALRHAALTDPTLGQLRPGSTRAIRYQIESRELPRFAGATRAIEARMERRLSPSSLRQVASGAAARLSPGDWESTHYRAEVRRIHAKAVQKGLALGENLPDSVKADILRSAEAAVRRTTRLKPDDTRWASRVEEERQDLTVIYVMGPSAAPAVQRPYYRPPSPEDLSR
ncbi:MAG TPA: hypothetical protein PLQ54_19830, partial [Armatimonadota bacterium]|nr:hypothetical protein [Armatimonadota bacterium]